MNTTVNQTLEDFERLGLNPRYYKPGLVYVYVKNKGPNAIYSNIRNVKPVIIRKIPYLQKKYRLIEMDPDEDLMKVRRFWEGHDCFGRVLVHEVLHDIYYGGGLSFKLREKYIELIKKIIFFGGKIIPWYPLEEEYMENEFEIRSYAAELFAILGDMILLGKTSGIPKELIIFFERLRLGR